MHMEGGAVTHTHTHTHTHARSRELLFARVVCFGPQARATATRLPTPATRRCATGPAGRTPRVSPCILTACTRSTCRAWYLTKPPSSSTGSGRVCAAAWQVVFFAPAPVPVPVPVPTPAPPRAREHEPHGHAAARVTQKLRSAGVGAVTGPHVCPTPPPLEKPARVTALFKAILRPYRVPPGAPRLTCRPEPTCCPAARRRRPAAHATVPLPTQKHAHTQRDTASSPIRANGSHAFVKIATPLRAVSVRNCSVTNEIR